MQNLLKLFSILQLTKEQPLTGYLMAGIKFHEMPTLAEHQYTAALMGYFLAERIKRAGGQIDPHKILVMIMIHDLGELFGGDISAPLNRKYPDLRAFKNKIGERAIDLLTSYLDEQEQADFKALSHELEEGTTDEALVSKIMDQIDHQFFLEHHSYKAKNAPTDFDYREQFIQDHIITLIEKISDATTEKIMQEFVDTFIEHYFNRGFRSVHFLLNE